MKKLKKWLTAPFRKARLLDEITDELINLYLNSPFNGAFTARLIHKDFSKGQKNPINNHYNYKNLEGLIQSQRRIKDLKLRLRRLGVYTTTFNIFI